MSDKKKLFNINRSKFLDSFTRETLRALDSKPNSFGQYESENEQEKNNHTRERAYSNAKKIKNFISKRNKKQAEEVAKVTKKATKKALISSKKSAVVKAGGIAAKKIAGIPVIVIVIIAFFIILILCLVFSVFEDFDYEEETRKLDTRANTAIKLAEQREEIDKLYDELIKNASSDEERARLRNNYKEIINSKEYVEFRGAEDPFSGYLLVDSTKNIFMNIERLCYAYGGYLSWRPEYLDNGVNIASESSVTVMKENLDLLKPLCMEIGYKYSIDPAILLAIIEVESGGDYHYNEGKDSKYKGLVSMPTDFNKFFDSSEEEYFYDDSMMTPRDIGSCIIVDSDHSLNARFQLEYLARKLTGEMTYFLQEAKDKDFILDKYDEKALREAILYSIVAYNQGEELQMDFYKSNETSGDIYGNNGTTYKKLFEKSMMDNGKKVGSKLKVSERSDGYMKEKENSTYLERVYKAYERYTGMSLNTCEANYDYKNAALKWYDNHFLYKKSYIGRDSSFKDISTAARDHGLEYDIEFSEGSTEKELVLQILKDFEDKEKIANIEYYNTYTKMIDNYYNSIKPDAFIKANGQRVPELYAKDANGKDIKSSVIKYQSYIHNVINTISKFNCDKSYSNGDKAKDYEELKEYLVNGAIEGDEAVSQKVGERLAGLEKEYALEVDDIVGQNLKKFVIGTDITDEKSIDYATDVLTKYLKYTIPMYEYVTLNTKEAAKTFFNYETYDSAAYNEKHVLYIDIDNMKNMFKDLNSMSVSLIDYTKGKIKKDEVKKAEKDIYTYLYLNNNKLVYPKNHNYFVPNNLSNYYMVRNKKYCDEYIENVITYEIYEEKAPEGTYVEWEATDAMYDNIPYKELKANITREYVTSSIKPYKFTSVLDKEVRTFRYDEIVTGNREFDGENYSASCEVGKVYKKDNNGNVSQVGTIYRKTVTRTNTYIEKLARTDSREKRE